MAGRNDITGDLIANNKGDHKTYSNGWEAIWGRKDKEQKPCYNEQVRQSHDKIPDE